MVGLEADDQLMDDRVDDVRTRVGVAVREATVHPLDLQRLRPTGSASSTPGASGGEDRGAAHFVESEARDDERRVARGPRVRREHVARDRVQERFEAPDRSLRVLPRLVLLRVRLVGRRRARTAVLRRRSVCVALLRLGARGLEAQNPGAPVRTLRQSGQHAGHVHERLREGARSEGAYVLSGRTLWTGRVLQDRLRGRSRRVSEG